MRERHSWTKDDEIISLDAYFRVRNGEDKKTVINEAVHLVNRRTQRDGDPSFDKHGSMRMKIQNWKYCDTPDVHGGLDHVADKSREIWTEYAHDKDKLARKMRRICESFGE